jgi:hypothetical protein
VTAAAVATLSGRIAANTFLQWAVKTETAPRAGAA